MLEARGRVGGRVHTLYGGDDGVPLDRGLRADVGGESIDDTHTALRSMVRRFGLETELRPGSTIDRVMSGRFAYLGRIYTFGELTALRNGAVLADYLRVYEELERLAESHQIDPDHPQRPTPRQSSISRASRRGSTRCSSCPRRDSSRSRPTRRSTTRS